MNMQDGISATRHFVWTLLAVGGGAWCPSPLFTLLRLGHAAMFSLASRTQVQDKSAYLPTAAKASESGLKKATCKQSW